MEKWLCWGAMGISGLVLLIFILDIALSFPFGGLGSAFGIIDILGAIACAIVLYLSFDTLKEWK